MTVTVENSNTMMMMIVMSKSDTSLKNENSLFFKEIAICLYLSFCRVSVSKLKYFRTFHWDVFFQNMFFC